MITPKTIEFWIEMAAVVKQNTTVTSAGNVAVGEVNRDKITIKTTGKTVTLPEFHYAEVNHYIRQSREYVQGRKLRTYVYFYFFQFVYLALFVAAFLPTSISYLLSFWQQSMQPFC